MRIRVDDLLDAAASAASWTDYERPLFAWLEHTVGFDVAFCVRHDGIGPHTPGFDPRVRRATAARFDAYGREYEPLKRKALEDGGAVIDSEFFGRTALERTLVYREMIQPHGGRSSVLLFMGGTPAPRALLVLGRTRGDFSETERRQLVAARSLLTVCEQAVASRQLASLAPPLSPRERELIQYLRLGYTNREIGAACGTSFRTVRNQLSQLFGKLEVSTRSEAVARSFELALAFE